MNAAERLREALNGPLDSMGESQRQAIIEDAARTIALPILGADPELVERIARILHKEYGFEAEFRARFVAQDILAALITDETTPAAAPPAAYDYETEGFGGT